MNILFFMNCYPDSRNGGIENVTRMISEQFFQKGINIHIRYLNHTDFEHTDDSIFKSSNYIEKTNVELEIKKIVLENKIDIIINRCVIWTSPILRKAIKGTNCKLITTYNNKPTLDPPSLSQVFNNKDNKLLDKILITLTYPLFSLRSKIRIKSSHQKSYNVSDITILLANRYIQEYVDLMKIENNKLVVLNNPIKENFTLSKNDLENKENIVLMVTRLDENQKCLIKALKIWQNVVSKEPTWKLVIVGKGPDEQKIKKYAKKKEIKNVEFVGACNPLEYYRKASIFLMTSRNEGWPNTINETMKMGCVPVVIASFSAIYEMINNNQDGLIITSSNEGNEISECTNAIINLISDPILRQKMAKNAVLFSERLSIDIISQKWINLFDKLIN